MKAKMSIDNRACVQKELMKLIEISLVMAVFAGIVITFITIAADQVQNNALTRYDELVAANGSDGLIALYNILANTQIVEVVLIAVFIFVVIFTLMKLMKSK